MAAPSNVLAHFALLVRLVDAGEFTRKKYVAAGGFGRTNITHLWRKFRDRGWCGEGEPPAILPAGRDALKNDPAPAPRPKLAMPPLAPEPADLRVLLEASPRHIAALRDTLATRWGPAFLAEMVDLPAPAGRRPRASETPKPRDLLGLLKLQHPLVRAALAIDRFGWGRVFLGRLAEMSQDLPPLAPTYLQTPNGRPPQAPPALPYSDLDPPDTPPPMGRPWQVPPTGTVTRVEVQTEAGRAALETNTPIREDSKLSTSDLAVVVTEPGMHFGVEGRDRKIRSQHETSDKAKRQMQRDPAGVRVVRLTDRAVMATKK